jgi:hypothetical protein
MKTKRASVIIAFATVVLTILLVGCEGDQGPEGPSGTTLPFIRAKVHFFLDESMATSPVSAVVYIDRLPEIPQVAISQISIPYTTQSESGELRFVKEDLPFSAGDQVALSVSYVESESANSTIITPGSFELTSPDTASTYLPLGDTLTFQWSVSEEAEAYNLNIRSNWTYIDSLGTWHDFRFYLDSMTTETQIGYPQDLLLPDLSQVIEVFYNEVRIELHAITGPVFEGDLGNITGDGIGMFNGYTYIREYVFHWQLPILLSSANMRMSESILSSDKQ